MRFLKQWRREAHRGALRIRTSVTLLLLFSMTVPLGAVLGVSLLPSAYAAPDPDLYAKTYGGTGDDEAWSVVVASDGDIIVAGDTDSFGAGGWDFWVLRLNSGGSIPDCDPIASTSVTPQSTSVSPDDTSVTPDDTSVTPDDTNITPALTNAQEATECYFAPQPVGGVIATVGWLRVILPWLILISLLGLGTVGVAFTVKRSNRR